MLAAWGVVLEMAWVEPAWAARWLKRRRRRKQRKEKAWLRSDSFSGSSPLVPVPSRGRLCRRGCVQVRVAGPCLVVIGFVAQDDGVIRFSEQRKGDLLSLLLLGPGFGLYSEELAAPRCSGSIQSA